MRPIPSLDNKYRATETGAIIGPRGRLSLFIRDGYVRCQAGGKQRRVNRLVCEAYHGPPPSAVHVAAHRDGVRWNNAPDNLYWATPEEYAADLIRHGSLRGTNHPRSMFSLSNVVDIRWRRFYGESAANIHKDYAHASYSSIVAICTGRNYRPESFYSGD